MRSEQKSDYDILFIYNMYKYIYIYGYTHTLNVHVNKSQTLCFPTLRLLHSNLLLSYVNITLLSPDRFRFSESKIWSPTKGYLLNKPRTH